MSIYINDIEYQVNNKRELSPIEVSEDNIKEMISKVNTDSIKTIYHSVENNSIRSLETVLTKWAKNKYHIYELFGRKLSIETEVDVIISHSEMNDNVYNLGRKFRKFQDIIIRIPTSWYINNTFFSSVTRVTTALTAMNSEIKLVDGMKLSKVLSKVFKDKYFDIELSKILQNTHTKRTVVASIDPMDYLTMSTNQHGWSSCHHIKDDSVGEWAGGCLTYMQDQTSIIGFAHNKKEYVYNFCYERFTFNSKTWRQVFFVNPNHQIIIGSRQYPYMHDVLSNTVLQLLQKSIGDDMWDNSMDGEEDDYDALLFYKKGYLFYPDLSHGAEGIISIKEGVETIEQTVIGCRTLCPSCGFVMGCEGMIVCEDCTTRNDND